MTATLVAGFVAVGASPAMAKEFRVDDDHAQCPTATFTSIQAAVDASGPKDTVTVCPGTYQEQVSITGPQHNGLKLSSLRPLQAVIKFPPVTIDSNILVRITQSRDVTLDAFTITGPFTNPGCDTTPFSAHEGVRVDAGGSALIRENHITQIQNGEPDLLGCQDGIAVRVGRAAESTTGFAVIEKNVIDTYQKNGPTIDGSGSAAEIHNNRIDGGGPNPIIAKNGIQIGRGAAADVTENSVVGNSYIGAGPPPAGDQMTDNDATGVLLFDTPQGRVRVHTNEVSQNDLGIALDNTQRIEVSENLVTQNKFDGIRAFDTTSQNVFEQNRLNRNAVHDCHDDSKGNGTLGTANFWRNNMGTSPGGDVPPGLCQKGGDGGHHGADAQVSKAALAG
jgi:parallel beta-helix repeat protein